MTARPVSRQVAQEAARWFLRLQGAATAQQQQACAAWRAADADHERAWQLAAQFSAQLQTIPPELARTTLQRPTPLGRRSTLKALTSLVLLGSLGVTLSRSGALDGLMADVSTRVGERRQLTLDDGSELHLNTDTAVDNRYSASKRTLLLRKGELYVSTGNDPRPMQVQSASGVFQPLGTRFSVRQFPDHDLLQVFEGAVAATPNQGGTLRVAAGETARVSDRHTSLLDGPSPRADWLSGMLRVEAMPLAEFVAELGRYRQGWIRCAPEVAKLRISGTYQLNDPDAALTALAMAFPVRLRFVTRYWVTVVPVDA